MCVCVYVDTSVELKLCMCYMVACVFTFSRALAIFVDVGLLSLRSFLGGPWGLHKLHFYGIHLMRDFKAVL